jgi:pimeloyl-ACP methyl ester carboxylesterase
MSDWNVTDFSLAARLADLEAIDALGHERVSLLGMSDGSPIALLYAARHPERVSRLVLYHGRDPEGPGADAHPPCRGRPPEDIRQCDRGRGIPGP